ncbi:MAG: MOSC domain-containing protein [Armatimonadota bacterium]|nr:MAG: MOSC domain-containing protein [Armatimonadota bacterium]
MGAAGRVEAVCIGERTGEPKRAAPRIILVAAHGVEGDAHAGSARQVSLLATESLDKLRAKGLEVGPGDLAENITTSGIGLCVLPVGTVLRIGDALLEVTQIGKECHAPCAIARQAGECVMPTEGIFARVKVGGVVRAGDAIAVSHPRIFPAAAAQSRNED